MAENNSSAHLKTARFPGEGGHSWTLSLNQLRGLIAELQNQLDSYEEDPDLEVQLVLSFVHPGLVKDEEDGTTNNVPLLTLHDAEYPEEGVYPINPLDCHAGVTIPPHAVAAQAAPAALEVKDDYRAWYIEAMEASNEAGFVGLSAADTIRALAATPALPATEDSSAGDLADWRTPTSYLHRFREAITLVCRGKTPPDNMLTEWLAGDSEELQDFAGTHAPAWAQGIGAIEAATVMADQPTEGVEHEFRDESQPLAEVQTEPVASVKRFDFGGYDLDVFRATLETLPPGEYRLYTAPQAQPAFQQRVQPWMMECFGAEHAADRKKRNQHFLEEALELVQSTGWTQSEAHQLVDYVYGRPAGEPAQEVGGVMVTLAALCLANHLDMHACGETELARIWSNVDNIRARQAAKPSFSPLPQAQPADALDAKRWRAAAHDLSLQNLAVVRVDDDGECEMLTGDEANEAIDTAMAAAQEGGNASAGKDGAA